MTSVKTRNSPLKKAIVAEFELCTVSTKAVSPSFTYSRQTLVQSESISKEIIILLSYIPYITECLLLHARSCTVGM